MFSGTEEVTLMPIEPAEPSSLRSINEPPLNLRSRHNLSDGISDMNPLPPISSIFNPLAPISKDLQQPNDSEDLTIMMSSTSPYADALKRDGNTSNSPVFYTPPKKPKSSQRKLYNHYTNWIGKQGIVADGFIKSKDHGGYGTGVFFTTLYVRDRNMSHNQIASNNWGPRE